MQSLLKHASLAQRLSTLDRVGDVQDDRSVWQWTKSLRVFGLPPSFAEGEATRDQLETLVRAIRGLQSVESVK